MASNIRVVVDEAKRGLVIRWFEDGLERHVWVDHGRFEELLASGETAYVDTRQSQRSSRLHRCIDLGQGKRPVWAVLSGMQR